MGLPEQTVESELVLRGELQDVDLETLLSALRLGRQYLTLELLDANGALTSSVAVKAGRILWASAGDQSGTDAVRKLLEDQEASQFRVWLQPSDAVLADSAQALGTIAELTHFEEAEPVERTHILQGLLSEHTTLQDLLRVVAFTRQQVSLELSDRESMLGEVCAKSGKILSAQAGELNELPALQALLRAPSGTRFDLYTEAQSVALLHPLGSLDELLRDASEPATASSNGVRKTAPPPLARDAHRSGTVPASQARILEGSLEEFELTHVLKVLSTSRQQFELHVRDDDAETVGVIEIKSGMVMTAKAGSLTGLEAARELLAARSGRFVAIRRAATPGLRLPIASVTELLHPTGLELDELGAPLDVRPALGDSAEESEDAGLPAPIPVLHGRLGDLDVASILYVGGASRQYTGVHIFDDQRRPLGTIHMKGSQVIDAEAQDVSGIAAVRRLLHSPRDFNFLVQRYPQAPEISASLGSTASVLQLATARVSTLRVGEMAPVVVPAAAAPATAPAVAAQDTEKHGGRWLSGAVVGAGFVLLGGIASAIVLHSPASDTSVSPSTSAAAEPTPAPPAAAPPSPTPPPGTSEAKPAEVAEPAAEGGSLENPNPNPNPSATAQPPAAPSRAAVASYQAGLRQLGYQTGPIDGVIGPQTTGAVKAFQYAEHLTADGILSGPTLAVLLRRISEP